VLSRSDVSDKEAEDRFCRFVDRMPAVCPSSASAYIGTIR
jgi:hypothetical protein